MTLFPIVSWQRVENQEADAALAEWGHFLGPCKRPFGKQSFGLFLDSQIVAVAVSATTPNARCGGYDRREVVELARLCAHPEHRDLTRVALRLWRITAPIEWGREHWPVRAVVSYSNSRLHSGDLYRFDGWKKVAQTRGGESRSEYKMDAASRQLRGEGSMGIRIGGHRVTTGEIERVLEIVFTTRRKSARTLRLEIIQALRREFGYDGGRCHACGFWKPSRLMVFDGPARLGGRCRLCNARQCRSRRKDKMTSHKLKQQHTNFTERS